MPGRDRTGPLGTGPIGRGMGPCGGGLGFQRGGGWGMGRGLRQGGGFGWRSTAPISADQEKTLLEERKSWLKAQVESVEKQLESYDKPEG
jgi:hypothetical protein